MTDYNCPTCGSENTVLENMWSDEDLMQCLDCKGCFYPEDTDEPEENQEGCPSG